MFCIHHRDDLQRIANMDLLDVLREKGDVLTVIAAGFRVISESTSEGNLPKEWRGRRDSNSRPLP